MAEYCKVYLVVFQQSSHLKMENYRYCDAIIEICNFNTYNIYFISRETRYSNNLLIAVECTTAMMRSDRSKQLRSLQLYNLLIVVQALFFFLFFSVYRIF